MIAIHRRVRHRPALFIHHGAGDLRGRAGLRSHRFVPGAGEGDQSQCQRQKSGRQGAAPMLPGRWFRSGRTARGRVSSVECRGNGGRPSLDTRHSTLRIPHGRADTMEPRSKSRKHRWVHDSHSSFREGIFLSFPIPHCTSRPFSSPILSSISGWCANAKPFSRNALTPSAAGAGGRRRTRSAQAIGGSAKAWQRDQAAVARVVGGLRPDNPTGQQNAFPDLRRMPHVVNDTAHWLSFHRHAGFSALSWTIAPATPPVGREDFEQGSEKLSHILCDTK